MRPIRTPAPRPHLTATFTDAELAQLERLAAAQDVGVGAMLYKLAKRALARQP